MPVLTSGTRFPAGSPVGLVNGFGIGFDVLNISEALLSPDGSGSSVDPIKIVPEAGSGNPDDDQESLLFNILCVRSGSPVDPVIGVRNPS